MEGKIVIGILLTTLFATRRGYAAPADTCNADIDTTTCGLPLDLNSEKLEFFPGIKTIEYEGPRSKNPLAFKYYNASELVHGRPMGEWLRFSVAFWHTMRGDGSDPFGSPTKRWPWEQDSEGAAATLYDHELRRARRRLDAFFEFIRKLGVKYWCFHDRDISPEGEDLRHTNSMFDVIIEYSRRLQKENDIRLLWGTTQLFKHPRYMHGAATSANAKVFAYAAASVKAAMEATHRLGGSGFVFWGGREGYSTLLNTNMTLEMTNAARFFRMAKNYAQKIGFRGSLMIEPKPQEPTKHQYDWDASTTAAFLLRHGLERDFKLNIECNHATLAGHSCFHELTYASESGLLGSIDANQGDPQTGWDTDEFLTDPREAALVALVILQQGGLNNGGINFDAKLHRESVSIKDLFIGHISAMDALARGLKAAARILDDGRLQEWKKDRYSSYLDTKIGR